jgi:hypothetical protein
VRVSTWIKKPRVIILLALAVHTSGYVLYRVETSNFQTVVPGKVYRSGQMAEAQWLDYVPCGQKTHWRLSRGARSVTGE